MSYPAFIPLVTAGHANLLILVTDVVEWSACRTFLVFSPKDVSLYTNSEQEADPTPKLAQNHVITQTVVLPELVRSSGVFLVVVRGK